MDDSNKPISLEQFIIMAKHHQAKKDVVTAKKEEQASIPEVIKELAAETQEPVEAKEEEVPEPKIEEPVPEVIKEPEPIKDEVPELPPENQVVSHKTKKKKR
jgi:nucleotide-binding universal stress UspA family protein